MANNYLWPGRNGNPATPVDAPDCGNIPSDSVIVAGGCVSAFFSGTLYSYGTFGCRVKTKANLAYYIITSYHTFYYGNTFVEDANVYYCNNGAGTQKQMGEVINKGYSSQVYDDVTYPDMDAVLIQLTSKKASGNKGGLYNNIGQTYNIQAAPASMRVEVGDIVIKYGIATGFTQGMVTSMIGSPDPFGFIIEYYDGKAVDSLIPFSDHGDSGGMVFKTNPDNNVIYPVGMITLGARELDGPSILSYAILAQRIFDKFNVSVFADPSP